MAVSLAAESSKGIGFYDVFEAIPLFLPDVLGPPQEKWKLFRFARDFSGGSLHRFWATSLPFLLNWPLLEPDEQTHDVCLLAFSIPFFNYINVALLHDKRCWLGAKSYSYLYIEYSIDIFRYRPYDTLLKFIQKTQTEIFSYEADIHRDCNFLEVVKFNQFAD